MSVLAGHLHGAFYPIPDQVAEAWRFLDRSEAARRASDVKPGPASIPDRTDDLHAYLNAVVNADVEREDAERRRLLRQKAGAALVEGAQNGLIDAVREKYADVVGYLSEAMDDTLSSVRAVAPAFEGIAPDNAEEVLQRGVVAEFRILENANARMTAGRLAHEGTVVLAPDRLGPDADLWMEFSEGLPKVFPAFNVPTAHEPWPEDAPLGRLLWLADLEPGAVWVPTVAEANAAAAKYRAERDAERERRSMSRRRGVAVGI